MDIAAKRCRFQHPLAADKKRLFESFTQHRIPFQGTNRGGRTGHLATAFPSASSGQDWEHYIRDDLDYQRHIDYVHVNPLKHGYVQRVTDWPYSSFHRYVAKGIYLENWCGDVNLDVEGGD